MDIRIVNTCNSDCIYCLEQSLRKKKKFLEKETIYSLLNQEENREVLSFYGGNPLLHPDLLDIIVYAKTLGYKNISLLTNTHGITQDFLRKLQHSGLTGISFYFHSFSENTHNVVVNTWISLRELLRNIRCIVASWVYYTCIIHVNKQNIATVYKNVEYLHRKFGVQKFEFIKYHLVSRAWREFRSILEYTPEEEKQWLQRLDDVMQKFWLQASYIKF